MSSPSPLGKFGPLVALAGVQLLIILFAPSVAPNAGNAQGVAGGAGGAGAVAGGAVTGGSGAGGTAGGAAGAAGGGFTGAGGGAAAGVPGSGVAGGSAGAAAGASGGRGGTGGAAAGPGASAAQAGDTSHCVGGRQYSPALDFFAPPCLPGQPGAPFASNGGATGPGVTADKIEIVMYVPDYGAEVDTILKAQGLYYNQDQAKVFNKAYEDFINSHYQLYGRKVKVDTFQGTCSTVPPNYSCLNGEMDKLVSTYKPYAVVFSTTLCSACYQELARLHVVSTGGAGFSDAFRNGNAPYIYDQGMSSTKIETQFADWWCNQMTSQGNSGRKAVFAGHENPAEDFTTKPRVLGVVATNDPDIEATVKNVLYPELKKRCGENVTHEYFYANDISTATQQSNAGTAAMNTPNNPATSVVCLCDPVAPQFSYNAAQGQNYWPEALIASNQAMDTDASAQTYVDSNGSPNLACPKPQQGCSFDGALGIGEAAADVPEAQLAGVKVFKAGAKGVAQPVAGITLQIFWDNYNMLASLISNTGPNLTAANMQAAAPRLGMRGGGTTGFALRGFVPGEWTWTRDVRVLYFNKHRTSPYNNKPGRWSQDSGARYGLGQFARKDQPSVPTADKRN